MFVTAFDSILPVTKNVYKISFSVASLCKKVQNKQTNKGCVNSDLVTRTSCTTPCYCYSTSPKTLQYLQLSWNNKNTSAPTRTHCRSRFGDGERAHFLKDPTRQQDLDFTKKTVPF